MTVTSGASTSQLSVVRGRDLSDSQADSAGSIPVTRSHRHPLTVTRSHVKSQVRGTFRRWLLVGSLFERAVRAISMQLAHRRVDPRDRLGRDQRGTTALPGCARRSHCAYESSSPTDCPARRPPRLCRPAGVSLSSRLRRNLRPAYIRQNSAPTRKRFLSARKWPGCSRSCPRPRIPGRAVSCRSWCPR